MTLPPELRSLVRPTSCFRTAVAADFSGVRIFPFSNGCPNNTKHWKTSVGSLYNSDFVVLQFARDHVFERLIHT